MSCKKVGLIIRIPKRDRQSESAARRLGLLLESQNVTDSLDLSSENYLFKPYSARIRKLFMMTPQKFSLSVDMACLNLGPWTPEPKADVRASLQELEDQVSRFLKLHEEHASKLDAEVVEIPICVTSNTVSDHGECDFNTSGGSADSKNIYNGSARQNGHSQVMSDKDVGVSCTSDGSTDSKNRHPDGAREVGGMNRRLRASSITLGEGASREILDSVATPGREKVKRRLEVSPTNSSPSRRRLTISTFDAGCSPDLKHQSRHLVTPLRSRSLSTSSRGGKKNNRGASRGKTPRALVNQPLIRNIFKRVEGAKEESDYDHEDHNAPTVDDVFN